VDRSQPLFFGAVGRLQPGTDRAVAASQLAAVAGRPAATQGDDRPRRPIHVDDLSEYYKSSNWRPLYFLLGASLLVLLLGTTNVAALVLGRAIGRSPEFALRGALGATRGAVTRQLLVEGALVAIPAGVLGVLLAQGAVATIATRLPEEIMLRGVAIPVDLRVAAVAFAASVLTSLVFALTPLAVTRRIDLSAALGAGGRTGRTAAEGRARLVLLTSQLALTMVLLSGAAVLLKSFVALTKAPLGFDPANLVSLRVLLGGPRYSTESQVRDYTDRLLAAAHATPGVLSAALGSSSPLASGPLVNFAFDDRPAPAVGREPRAILRAAGPGYFRTLGISMHRGREFTAADLAGAPRVAIVNEHLAKQIAPEGDPIGRTIELLPGGRAAWTRRPGTLTVIGVSGNIKEVAMNEMPFAGIYVPLAQMTPPTIELIARGAVPAAVVSDALQSNAAAIDPAVPVGAVTQFDDRIDRALRPDRFNLQLVAGFALAGMLLAAVGIYGAIAYAVQRRTRELGVRLALGARPARLMTSAVWLACRIGVAGAVLGLAATLLIARLIGDALYLVPGSHNGLLYGVTTTDPLMLGAAFAGITAAAVLAAIGPARRILRVDPVRALRCD
jgi:predicted permease